MIDRFVRLAAFAAPLVLAPPLLARELPVRPAAAGEAPAVQQPSPGVLAARDRQKKCGAEWRALTDAQKTAQGPKWPQFWSACNKRLKGGDKA